MQHLPHRVAGFGLAALLALSACSSTPATSSGTPASAEAPPSAVAVSGAAAEKAVKSGTEAYHQALDAFVAASNQGTADTGELGKYASGRALITFQGILGSYQQQGVRTNGKPRIDEPIVTGLTPPADPAGVQLRGCIDISSWPLTKTDGSPADKVGGQQETGPSVILANVARTGAAWQVTELAIQGPCSA